MVEKKLLTRKVVQVEWKMFGLGVPLGFFVATIILCMVLKPYMDPRLTFEVLPHERLPEPLLVSKCNFTGRKSDFCELNGDIRIQANSCSIFFNSPQLTNNTDLLVNHTLGIKLLARKDDGFAMEFSKQFWLKPLINSSSLQQQTIPNCTITSPTLPAIVFSSGGYAGNLFHDNIDILVPLYMTSIHFNGEVQLIAQDRRPNWIRRHEVMFKALSNYDIIDLNNDNETRCFKHVIVGLKAHDQVFLIDPNKDPFGLTIRNYTHFNRQIYSLEREKAINLTVNATNKKPRLLIISRKHTRKILNEEELVKVAQNLGYEVEIMDPKMPLKNFSKIVNSMDVMIGVHGAGISNMVYLPENAVLIQIVGIGMEIISDLCFGRPAKAMNFRYLNYEIGPWESSLIQQYARNHQIITNPRLAMKGKNWMAFKIVYLDKQDVRLDMNRFKKVLVKALNLLRA